MEGKKRKNTYLNDTFGFDFLLYRNQNDPSIIFCCKLMVEKGHNNSNEKGFKVTSVAPYGILFLGG